MGEGVSLVIEFGSIGYLNYYDGMIGRSVIMAIRISAVLREGDNPDILFSCSHSSVWHRLPSSHLHPSFRDFRKALMSSM